jgi:hypothetical protein
MEHLNSIHAESRGCAICGSQIRDGEIWFSITENAWEDRLHIWRWDGQMHSGAKLALLCSPRHVRELIRHWMASSSLQYPFAASRASLEVKPTSPRQWPESINDRALKHLGEIMVDRGGVARALLENPLSLNTLLDELMIVLESEIAGSETEEFQENHCFAPSRL